MVAEMTGSISAIEPGMIAVGVAWLIVWRTDVTMYTSQLIDRDHAPGRRLLSDVPLLEGTAVRRAMNEPRLVLGDHLSVGEARTALSGAGLDAAPVIDRDRRFEGTVSATALLAGEIGAEMRGLVDAGAASVAVDATVDIAVDALASGESTFVTILDEDRRVVGTLAVSDLLGAYRRELQSRAGGPGGDPDSRGVAPAPVL